MIWYAIVLHGYWGVTTLISDVSARGYALYHLRQFIPEHLFLGAFLLTISLLALISLLIHQRKQSLLWHKVSIVLLLPQQAALVVAAVGAASFIIEGTFAIGSEAPRLQIASVMMISIIVAVFHSMAMVDHIRNGYK